MEAKSQDLGNTFGTTLFSVREDGAAQVPAGHNCSEPDLGQDRSPKAVQQP
jgi:hypothetical protein